MKLYIFSYISFDCSQKWKMLQWLINFLSVCENCNLLLGENESVREFYKYDESLIVAKQIWFFWKPLDYSFASTLKLFISRKILMVTSFCMHVKFLPVWYDQKLLLLTVIISMYHFFFNKKSKFMFSVATWTVCLQFYHIK